MKPIKFVFLIKLSFYILSNAANEASFDSLESKYGKLIHVSVIFRHGDRSPLHSYPRDPHATHSWENGNGQLFEEGKRKIFLLGKWLRNHYKELLQSVHHHTDLKVHSSDTDRTIMSAQCLLAAFYPPDKSQILKKSLNWQPVPVHVISQYSNMIYVYQNCPAADYLSEKFFTSKKMKKKYDAFKSDFSFMEKHSGLKFPIENVWKAVSNAYTLWDILTIEKKQNLTLPKWTQKIYPKTLEKIMHECLYKEMKSLKLQRLLTGRIFKSLTVDMQKKVKNPNSTNIFHFYSGHETLLAPILNALGTYDGEVPSLGSTIMFEVRKKNTGPIITIKYMKTMADGFKLLQIPKFKTPCTLKGFLNLMKPLIPKNMEVECRIKKKKEEAQEY